MHPHGTRKSLRVLAILFLTFSVSVGLASTGTAADTDSPVVTSADEPQADGPTAQPSAEPTEPTEAPSRGTEGTSEDSTSKAAASAAEAQVSGAAPHGDPYGSSYPVTLESNFARPYKSISSYANSDFSQLDDLERLIKGTWYDPNTKKLRSSAIRSEAYVYISVSRMENSYRVGRALIAAADHGVDVYMIHGKASQSKESRSLQASLTKRKHGHFKICAKGKSLACLSTISGAIMHSKILVVNQTFTRDKKRAVNAIWTGSANLGGPSGERTFNNGLTIYNDQKIFTQMKKLYTHMYHERSVGNDTMSYFAKRADFWGISASAASAGGYTHGDAYQGMFYSNLANVTIYPTPIYATPTNGKDPVLNLLNRVVPDGQCRIRLQQNRFKYRRIAVAYKLADLANRGCKVSVVSFEDDLKINRTANCQQYLRVCRPILDVFKTANQRIDAYWAKPHDKTILVDALLKRNELNKEETSVDGERYNAWGGTSTGAGGVVRTKLVQAGSAALTGSNLIASDEVTTETTDAGVYDEYLQHWKAILASREIHRYPY